MKRNRWVKGAVDSGSGFHKDSQFQIVLMGLTPAVAGPVVAALITLSAHDQAGEPDICPIAERNSAAPDQGTWRRTVGLSRDVLTREDQAIQMQTRGRFNQ
jgi:hypothetical protein